MLKPFLFKPVKNLYVGQGFGQSNACIDDKGKIISKVGGVCPAGSKSFYESVGLNGHNGLDISANRWQPIYASCEGVVEEVQTEEAKGLGIGIITENKYFCVETGQEEHFKHRYWHFIGFNVNKGDKVKIGDLVGYADSTGYSSGDHLHFELKPVRKNSKGEWYNALQTNGYYGCVDPSPYMLNVFAGDADKFKKILETFALILDKISDILRGQN